MLHDPATTLAGLKDFQRATVDYAFARLYEPASSRRFLVADEVGLGKTLIAKGVIAKSIAHLSQTQDQINIVYVCSNADIARQNIKRLRIPGIPDAAQATRLTLLPLELKSMAANRVNFIALTPTTSFDGILYLPYLNGWPKLRSNRSVSCPFFPAIIFITRKLPMLGLKPAFGRTVPSARNAAKLIA